VLETAGRKANGATPSPRNLKPAFWLVLVQGPRCYARGVLLFLAERNGFDGLDISSATSGHNPVVYPID